MDFSNQGGKTNFDLGVYPECGIAFRDRYHLLDAYDAGGMGECIKRVMKKKAHC